jgi:hypothetical protein
MIIRKWAVDHGIHIENCGDCERTWIFRDGGSRISWCPITKQLSHWVCDCWGRPQQAATWEDAKAIIHTAWGLESLGQPRNSFRSFTRIA